MHEEDLGTNSEQKTEQILSKQISFKQIYYKQI